MLRAGRCGLTLCSSVLLLVLGLVSADGVSAQRAKGPARQAAAADRQATLVFNTASRLYRQENWRDAAASFGQFLKRFPRHADAAEARFARGYCHNRLGDHASAVTDLELAGGDARAKWAADAKFYLGRSLEALAAKEAEGSAKRKERYRGAATSYGVCATLRAKAIEALPTAAPSKRRLELIDQLVQAITSQGEAAYHAGAHSLAVRALGPLLASRERYSRASTFSRGFYFLALSNYAIELAAEKSGKGKGYTATLECLGMLTTRAHEGDSLWADAAFLHGRILHRGRRWSAAISLYGRLIDRRAAQQADSGYYRALAYYEMGSTSAEGGASLARAATEFEAFYRAYPKHANAIRARYHEALAHFNRQDYTTATGRLAAFTSDREIARKGEPLLSQAWLCLGQSLLLKKNPDPVSAAKALATAGKIARLQAKAGTVAEAGVASERLARSLYWQGEALFSAAQQSEGPDERAGLFVDAARSFAEVAGPTGKSVPALREEALHKQAESLLRAGQHAECATVAKLYRKTYVGQDGRGGRFHAESLKLSGRNALRAGDGALPAAERRAAATYYAAAAALVKAPKENRRLRYLSGVAHYYNDDFVKAAGGLAQVYGELVEEPKLRVDYEEIAFFLADSLAQQPRPGKGDVKGKQRVLDAAALFGEYLDLAVKTPGKSAARHVATARINQGLCCQWADDLEGARQSFETFLSEHPNHDFASRIRFSLAGICLDLEDEDGALSNYAKVAASTDDRELAARSLLQGAALERRRDKPAGALPLLAKAAAAIAELGQVDAAKELLVDARYQHAMALVESEQAEKAAPALATYLKDFPKSANDSYVRLQLAYLLLDRGDPRGALASVQPVCDLKPTAKTGTIEGRDEALYLRAWSYGVLADVVIAAAGDGDVPADSDEGRQIASHHAEMEATYRRLISEYPASDFSRDAMLELGQHLFNLSSYAEAKKWFSALRKHLEKSAAATSDATSDPKRRANLLERSVYGLAFVSFEEGDYVGARALFDKVARQIESELAPRAVFQSARSWMLSRADREAVKRFERIVTELKPRAGEYYEESLLRLGECHHRLQEYDKAAEVLARLLKEFPTGDLRHEARFALGFAQQYLDEFDDAVKSFRQVVTDTPGVVGSRAQYHVGECFMDQKKYREAAREFLVVVANFDFEGGYRDWFRRALLSAGLAYQADGDAKAARQQWKELLERFPESPEAKAAKQRLGNAGGESKKTN